MACYRDGSTGGCIRLFDITKDKVEREFHPHSTFLIKKKRVGEPKENTITIRNEGKYPIKYNV